MVWVCAVSDIPARRPEESVLLEYLKSESGKFAGPAGVLRSGQLVIGLSHCECLAGSRAWPYPRGEEELRVLPMACAGPWTISVT
jgi:hypothetical protein